MPPLGEAASELLLRGQAGANVLWEGSQAKTLVKLSGGNPLVMTVLAGILHEGRCTPAVSFFFAFGHTFSPARVLIDAPPVACHMRFYQHP